MARRLRALILSRAEAPPIRDKGTLDSFWQFHPPLNPVHPLVQDKGNTKSMFDEKNGIASL